MRDDVRKILYELVAVQSDTGTAKEVAMAEKIYEITGRQQYFKGNPQLFGKYYGEDSLKRPVVWAIHKGKTNKTIILTGHYDCVEIDSFGAVKEWALKPDELREKLRAMDIGQDARVDLEDTDWVFGRGVNDMKAGIAMNIHMVSSCINEDVNVLMVVVHDEENLSAGMRQAGELFEELKRKFNLEYKLLVLTEPHMRKQDDIFKISVGTVGKIMPAIVAKGHIAHGSNVMEGLNSTLLISQIISDLELNPKLCSTDMGMTTPPPTVLYARDMKEIYDVSVPEYSAIYMNYQFLKTISPVEILENIKNICKESLHRTISTYDRVWDTLEKKGALKGKTRRNYKVAVYTFAEIEKLAKSNNNNYNSMKKELEGRIYEAVKSNKMTIQDAGIAIIKGVIEISYIREPVVVVGFIPPYYPPANNSYLPGDISGTIKCIESSLATDYGLKLEVEPYFMGICDISYASCTNRVKEEKIMSNMVTLDYIYNIPFDYMEKLSVPSIVIGPWGKDYHTIMERVYMPDVENVLPNLIRKIVNTIK